MVLNRLTRRTSACLSLTATALLVLTSAVLFAQAPAVVAPASTLPSVPAPTQQPAPAYADPLLQPITATGQAPTQPSPASTSMPPPISASSLPSYMPYDTETGAGDPRGSTYIPVDSTIYPMALRLYSMGYLDTAFINMRPWTRRALLHMLQQTTPSVMADGDPQAIDIVAKIQHELIAETPAAGLSRGTVYGLDTAYTRVLGISGQTLRDSYHLGQTIAYDYGRPYQEGFNNTTGFSTVNEYGRFSLYIRGEYQHSPAATGYNLALANYLSNLDTIGNFTPPNAPQATIPYGNLAAQNPFRLQEALLSFHILGHEISGGKSDAWLGPGQGGSLIFSNNAENIYAFHLDRVDPLYIPYISRVFGPVRYNFQYGSLKGHTYPNSPYTHTESFSFAPTSNFQFAFARTIIFGGEGHSPVTLHTFIKGFFSTVDGSSAGKNSRNDPGARYSDFNFSWRLPFLRKYVTLYADTIAHDDVTPISAPRRAAYRPGLYLTKIPGLPRLDLRVEAASTDTSTLRSLSGQFNYFEIIEKQGYTNKGFIMGDVIGREAKGGNAWLTYHLSGNEWIQLSYLNKKTPKDFIGSGTTQNQFKVDVVKRLTRDLELDAWLQYERWKAPVYITNTNNNLNTDTAVAFTLTWHPRLRTTPNGLPK